LRLKPRPREGQAGGEERVRKRIMDRQKQRRHRNVFYRCVCYCFCYCCCSALVCFLVPIRVISRATPAFASPYRDEECDGKQHAGPGAGPSCGVRQSPLLLLLVLLLPAAAAARSQGSLKTWERKDIPARALASWPYLLWYSAFSGFSRAPSRASKVAVLTAPFPVGE